ncbi:hypothetical protein K435DRAFT_794863 [Dendrothele bispora CBS 962.96]|uniref:Uncharacterized protein n=1 Tax=Dendrothele bispora (strain CBS 962.96) TaxID=1314807 RepID=A0A4V6T5I6_DENBC|nr:hypothetical protein K435DRAFT_794863 [Dendrothele bispora CBS 962.96]
MTHLDFWVETCNQMGIDITAKEALPFLEGHCLEAEEDVSKIPRLAYSKEAFLDAICKHLYLSSSNNLLTILQAIYCIENVKLRAIFLMLKKDLKDKDIPRRNTICIRILTLWDHHLDTIHLDFQIAPGKISFTMDLWSNTQLVSFMAVTAHWVEATDKTSRTGNTEKLKLKYRAELIDRSQFAEKLGY